MNERYESPYDSMVGPEWTPMRQPGDRRAYRSYETGQRYREHPTTGKRVSVPKARYEYWVNPAGTIVPLVVSSNHSADELEQAGYDQKIQRFKARKKWIRFHPPREVEAMGPEAVDAFKRKRDDEIRRRQTEQLAKTLEEREHTRPLADKINEGNAQIMANALERIAEINSRGKKQKAD